MKTHQSCPAVYLASLVLVAATVSVACGDLADDSTHSANHQNAASSQSATSSVPSASEARAALASGQPRRALALLGSRAIRLAPAERHALEGRAYLQLGDSATARRKLEAAIRLRPKQASDLYWLGRAYAACGMPALAARRFQEAYWNGLDTADLHYHWAVALTSLHEPLGKISQRRWPDEADGSPEAGSFALEGLIVGPVRTRPGWVIVSPADSAIYQAHRALELAPQRGEALLLCGELWAAANRHKRAVSLFARAARRLQKSSVGSPSHVSDGDRAGSVQLRQLRQARIRCRQCWATSLLALGDCDAYLEQSREHLRAAGGIDSVKLARCYDRAAREVAQQGDLKRQIRYLTLSVELKPETDRLIALADALLQAERAMDADRYLRLALEHRPTPRQRKQILLRLAQTTYLASPR